MVTTGLHISVSVNGKVVFQKQTDSEEKVLDFCATTRLFFEVYAPKEKVVWMVNDSDGGIFLFDSLN